MFKRYIEHIFVKRVRFFFFFQKQSYFDPKESETPCPNCTSILSNFYDYFKKIEINIKNIKFIHCEYR